MKQEHSSGNKPTSKAKPQHHSTKQQSTESKLDKAIEMTFPASDPVSITQPKPNRKPDQKKEQ